jgi:hypothetical protein
MGALPSGLKWPVHEADPSSLSQELKNGGAIPPLTHTALWRGMRVIDYVRDSFTFYVLNKK